MYSVVLAMALAGSAEAPDCNCFSMFMGGGCFGRGQGCYGQTYGGCFGGGGGCHGYGGCQGSSYGGCHGGGGYYGNQYSNQGTYYYGQPATQVQPEKLGDPKKTSGPLPATMQVRVPPNTKLTVAGYVSKQTSTERTLITPPIQPGEEFTYTLVAESILNGQRVSQSQQVTLRPGQDQAVAFTFTSADVVDNRR